MSSPLDAMTPRGDQDNVLARPPADTREPPGWFEFDWDATKASAEQAVHDVPGRSHELRQGRLAHAAAELAKLTGKRPTHYYLPLMGEPVGAPTVDEAGFWRDLAQLRRTRPDALADMGRDRADFDKRLKGEFQAGARERGERMSKGGLIGNLAGGAVGAMTDPINLLTMPFGGGGKTIAAQIIRNAVLNAGIEAAETPFLALERRQQGGELTGEEALFGIAAAGIGGAGLTAVAKGAEWSIGTLGDATLDWRMAQALKRAVPDEALTPEQAAALHVVERSAEVDATSPYQGTYEAFDAHAAKIDEVLADLAAKPDPAPAPAPLAPPAPRATVNVGGTPDFENAWKAIIGIEGGTNRDGSFRTSPAGAIGPAQVMPGTAPEAARLAGLPFDNHRYRTDAAYNIALGRAYYREQLRRFDGDPVKAAAAYNAGPGNVQRALSRAAERGGDWVDHLPAETRAYVANFRRRTGMGGTPIDGGAIADLGGDLDAPIVRPDALDTVRPLVTAGGREVPIASFDPDEIGVDATLMQFKSGGDDFGVTERLHGVQAWDPIAAGMVTVWESVDGRRLIADGHQRLGLAKRLRSSSSQPIRMNAFVLREADGLSARDARALTALKNIGEGTGTATDAAKVFRAVGLDPDVLKRLPPRAALVRDGKSLARLSDEAFGAVVNEVIPESHGAAIGALADDPATHLALVDLLAKTDPPNRRQAEAIVRQALDAGFSKEHQVELFGGRDVVSALFVQKAKLLDKTLSELRKLKGAFQVAARNKDALEGAGNTIDAAASEAAAAGNAQALALVESLALRKGNGVAEIFNRAGERLAAGEPLARVTRDVVAELRELDLAAALRDAGGAGDAAGGSGRGGEPDGEVRAREADDRPLTDAERDALEAEGQSAFSHDEAAGKLFDDPRGQGIAAAADSAWHDLAAADPNVAAVQRQQAELGAAAPMRANVDQDGTMGSPLFDAADQPTFDLDDGKGPRTAAEIYAELEDDLAAIDTIEACLRPPAGGAA